VALGAPGDAQSLQIVENASRIQSSIRGILRPPCIEQAVRRVVVLAQKCVPLTCAAVVIATAIMNRRWRQPSFPERRRGSRGERQQAIVRVGIVPKHAPRPSIPSSREPVTDPSQPGRRSMKPNGSRRLLQHGTRGSSVRTGFSRVDLVPAGTRARRERVTILGVVCPWKIGSRLAASGANGGRGEDERVGMDRAVLPEVRRLDYDGGPIERVTHRIGRR